MTLHRDRATVLSYLGLGLLGYVLNGLGPVLPHLQEALDLSRTQVARYPTFYAAGWLATSAVGDRLVGKLGRDASFRAAAAGLGVGAGLLAIAPNAALTGAAAAVMGVAGALMLMVVLAVLADRHGDRAVAALAEANAVSSFAAIAAPLVIAATLAVGLGWPPGFAALPLAAAGLLAIGKSGAISRPTGRTEVRRDRPATLAPELRPWVGIILVVGLEFAFVFWATDYLRSVIDLSDAASAAVTSLFFVGMAVARAFGGRLLALLERRRRALLVALSISMVGFAIFWTSRFVPLSGVLAGSGLLLAGVGVAYLYPLSFAELVEASTGGTDRASARAALASGLAIGLTPLALGRLADAAGLTQALLLIPVLVMAAAVNVATVGRRRLSITPRRTG